MKKSKNNLKNHILICVALAVFVAGAVFAMFSQQRVEPVNVLDQSVSSSMNLIAEGSKAAEEEDKSKEDEEEKDDEQKDKEKDKEEQGNKDKNESDQNDNAPGNDNDGENNGDGNGSGVTDIIYFTTTIKDGETVTSKAYSFSIFHKIETLTPKETKIFVNGELKDHIKDARTEFDVFLEEGENILKVQVVYENENGQLIAPYKNYMINVDTRSLVINSSLNDSETVESPYLTFTASASFGDEDVDLMVTHNGDEIFRNDGVYEAELTEGENRFVMNAEYDAEHAAEKKYIIYYVPPKGLHIETDLQNQTVESESPEFTFRAAVTGGSGSTEFTVSMNNKVIYGENGEYNVELLPQGQKAYNIIRMKAVDGEEEDSLTFKIKYIPLATPDTEPEITHINIKDGQTLKKKNPFVLELAAADYKGNKIYFDGMDVYLNGKHQILRETKPYATYHLNFVEGQNEVEIKITDNDGRYKVFNYSINYVPPDENEKIGTVTVSMDANVLGIGTLIPGTTVDIYAADSLASVIVRTLQAKGFSSVYEGSTDSSFYLKAVGRTGIGSRCNIPEELKTEITDFGVPWLGSADEPERAANTLGDDDYTAWSGWLIQLDGSYISTTASEINPEDGSIIKIRYSLAYGMDIGSSYQGQTFENTY